MAHHRRRHLISLLKSTLAFSPIVGVLGHRQVGKSTLVAKMASKYVTLDDRLELHRALTNPDSFLESHMGGRTPLVIDECQFAPPLFSSLKEWVRTHPKPGQVLLTGSVRFSSRRAIRESLTGRIITWELLPMDLSETYEAPLPDALARLVQAKDVAIELKKTRYFSDKTYSDYLLRGGLPGVFAVRNAAVREQRFETQIETVLERDLRLLIETSLDYRTLRALLKELAHRQSMPVEWTELSRRTRISIPTLKKLIRAFESLFLIRTLETKGTEKKPVIFLEDQGEATFLLEGYQSPFADLTRFLFANIRHQAVYRPDLKIRFFQYRNRGGAQIPLCAQSPSGAVGFIPCLSENPEPGALANTRSFLKIFPNAKIVFFHRGSNDRIIDKKIRVVGLNQLV